MKPEEVTRQKFYKDGDLVEDEPVKFIERRDGDLRFETEGGCIINVSENCFPEHAWKSGPVGKTEMKTIFEE